MKNIEVFVADSDGSMLINVDDAIIELTAKEAAYLASMMARADKSFHFVQHGDPDGPLTSPRPSRD